MRRLAGFTCAGAAALIWLVSPVTASADHSVDLHSPNVVHVHNAKNTAPGGTNSDLAFWGNIAAVGNYNGFRLFDIRKPESPRLLSAFRCRGPQNDVSFYQAKERLLLIQSIDTPQTTRDCTSRDSVEVQPGDFEGLRIFDVTDPTAPVHIASVETRCGSHTHTTIPDDNDQRAIVYVSSYPLAPTGIGDECQPPHSRISIVEIPDANPEAARVLKEQPIHAQPVLGGPEGAPGTIGCHDITAFYDTAPDSRGGKKVAAAACLTEGQLWDITDPENPCTVDESCHTHIDNPLVEVWHSSAFTWDERVALFGDEHGGGSAPGCEGEQDKTGNIWFYENNGAGAPAPLLGRYHIPRPQGGEECTLHNFSVIPINDNKAYIGVSSAYRGGTTVFDFTDAQEAEPLTGPTAELTAPLIGREIGFYDSQSGDGQGGDDVWSSYWYNDFIYANGGLGSRDTRGDRGFDVYKLLRPNGKQFTARSFHHFNPQTQEVFETLGK